MQLNKFQEQFKDLMLDQPKALDNPPADFAAFCETGHIDLSARLKVYRNNIVGSLTDVILATFPIVEILVGKPFLEGMARSFVLENPPTHGCLGLYGSGFAEFIETFELARSLPYLPDIARFELALNKAYYAADDEVLSIEMLSNIPPENLSDTHLPLRASVELIQSVYPLSAIQAFCLSENHDTPLNLDQGGEKLMIHRPRLETTITRLDDDEFLMLQELSKKTPLGGAVDTAVKIYEHFDFQAFLQKHIALETFRSL